MRRLLALAALTAAAATVAPMSAASAAPTCTGGNPQVCVQVVECARICTVHVIVDPQCSDHYQTIWCRTIDDVYVDLPAR